MRKIIILIILFYTNNLFAEKDIKYPVSEIPVELKKNVKAVVRNNNVVFTVESKGQGRMDVSSVITIMNKSGEDYSEIALTYNKFIKVRNIKATYYDQNGNEIKSLKKSDLVDVPSISGYSLFEDSRTILFDPDITNYPFTIEYSFTMDFNGLFSYPDVETFDDYNISIEKSNFIINVPKDIGLRLLDQNFDIKPLTTEKESITTYQWEIINKPAIEYEPYSPPFGNFEPKVYLTPTQFEIGGIDGNMKTWNDYGQWIYTLNQDKNNLLPETQQKIKDLIKDAKTDFEKVSIIYKYLQNKTRYVNIAVGLGGWQPIDAQIIDRLSYGDCKALSNYMVSLLEVAGIKSYYTLVNAGAFEDFIISDFPMNQFNHAIVCVPLQGDTIWLECTNQRYPAGYIGDFTDDRDVLLIKDGNSQLAKTKMYSKNENYQKRQILFNLNSKGEGSAEIFTSYVGLKTENVFNLLYSDPEDVKRYLYNNLNLSNFSIDNFNYSLKDSIIPSVFEKLNIQVKSYASVMGNRLIVPANMIGKIEKLPKKVTNRSTNVFVRRSRLDIDSTNFIIPEGYMLESLPKPVEIISKYGDYKLSFTTAEGMVICTRKYSLNKGDYPPTEYEMFRSFLEEISRADNLKFTLLKK